MDDVTGVSESRRPCSRLGRGLLCRVDPTDADNGAAGVTSDLWADPDQCWAPQQVPARAAAPACSGRLPSERKGTKLFRV